MSVDDWDVISCIAALKKAVEVDNSKRRKTSAAMPTRYIRGWDHNFHVPSHFLRAARIGSLEGTTVSDISENSTSPLRAQYSFLAPRNFPVIQSPSSRPPYFQVLAICSLISSGGFRESQGSDLSKRGAEPDVLGGLMDTGGLNSPLKFFHVMGDFGPFEMGKEHFVVPGRF